MGADRVLIVPEDSRSHRHRDFVNDKHCSSQHVLVFISCCLKIFLAELYGEGYPVVPETLYQGQGQIIHPTITVSCDYLSLPFSDTYLRQDPRPHM